LVLLLFSRAPLKTIDDVAGGIPRARAFGGKGGREFSRADIKAARERHVHTSPANFGESFENSLQTEEI